VPPVPDVPEISAAGPAGEEVAEEVNAPER
jgi:hypothetical protein